MLRCAPIVVCFNGKRAAQVYFGRKRIQSGSGSFLAVARGPRSLTISQESIHENGEVPHQDVAAAALQDIAVNRGFEISGRCRTRIPHTQRPPSPGRHFAVYLIGRGDGSDGSLVATALGTGVATAGLVLGRHEPYLPLLGLVFGAPLQVIGGTFGYQRTRRRPGG